MRDHRLGGARVAAAALLALAGCSLVYDAGGFDTRDAAPPDGPVIIYDADIAGLELTGFQPVDLAEGFGCIHDGTGCTEAARAIPVVVTGANIDASATVTLDGAGYSQQVVPATFSADHTMVAFAVRIPPDLGLAAGDSAMLTVTVAQGEVSAFVDIPVTGLDDFVASVDAASGTLDASALDARYATVNIDADIRFTGNTPVKLTAMSAFTIDATLDVSGLDAGNGTVIGVAGPGGCAGGPGEAAGGCGAGGGRAGANNEGGGGGGHRTEGTIGVGTNAGAPGAAVCDARLGAIGTEDVAQCRGNGGGGGGPAGLTAAEGGAGGGGGGVLVLTSEGDLSVGSTASLLANGGAGGEGAGACVLGQHGGGGGGGSGGAILLRARGTFAATGGSSSVSGGAGGNPPNQAGCNDGGAGAPGRVRIDLASADADPAPVNGTSAFRGIAIDPALPPVVTEADVNVAFFGGPNLEYRIQVEGQGKQIAATSSNRTGTATVALQRGTNRVCVLVNDAVNLSSDEGAQCVTIAYMPQ